MAGQIFSGNINALAISWMMIYMLLFAVAWEAWCGFLTERAGENRAQQEMLVKVAKELMILGFIAFGVILLKEFNVFVWNSDTLLTFEFCDLLISICVLIYVANCFISSLTMATTQRRWDRMAMQSTTAVVAEVKAYLSSLDGSCWRRFKYHLPVIGHHWRVEADFKIMQLLFESQYHLPTHFDYVDYMKLVLQNVVISMANIETLHWVLLMAINAVWWLVLKFTDAGTPDDHICLFTPDCTAADEDRRRQLGAQEDACPCMNSTGTAGPDDIGATETRNWLWLFVAIGWFVTLVQALIVHSLNDKMQEVIASVGADKSDKGALERIMLRLSKEVSMHADAHAAHMDKQKAPGTASEAPGGEETEEHPNPKHHVTAAASKAQLLEPSDHILQFQETGKDSNDILSLKRYETIMFWTKFVQLVMDFYLGFYVVHMRLRVRRAYGLEKATDGDLLPQLLFHAAQITPVLLTLYLLMLTARKIALLVGVLHKDDDAVGDVLRHMEQVRAVRQRIKDALASIHSVSAQPDPSAATAMLQKAKDGELALLATLDDKYGAGSGAAADVRLERNVITSMIKEKADSLSFTAEEFSDFASRETFLKLDPEEYDTAHTACTLKFGVEEASDSIEVRELCAFLVRHCTAVVSKAESRQASADEVKAIDQVLHSLSIIDREMLLRARDITRATNLFRAADLDGGGTVGRLELFFTLRRFKVPVTKAEYAAVFRVIDPDQSHSITMAEWLKFMSTTDSGMNGLNKIISSDASNPRP